MHNQPNPSTPAPSVSNVAAVCLASAAVAGSVLAVIIYVDLTSTLEPARGVTGLLAAVCAVSGFGYISRSAEERIGRREAAAVAAIIDRIDQMAATVPVPGVPCAPVPRPGGRMYLQRLAPSSIDGDTEVTRLPSPDLLRAARNLAGKVIASEDQRVEDNTEDTTGLGRRRNGSTLA